MSSLNTFNVRADKNAHGKWGEFTQDYFSHPEILEELWQLFSQANLILPNEIDVAEFGSAEGEVGEHLCRKLAQTHETHLTIVDVVEEHLQKNANPRTRKVCADLLTYTEQGRYDLGLARSVLHYFSEDDQKRVLMNMRAALKPGGTLFLSTFIQHLNDLDLFLAVSKCVGKNLVLISQQRLEALFRAAGFTSVRLLGDATTWHCSSAHLQRRYNLSDARLQEIRTLIEEVPPENRAGFQLFPHEFTIPIPFKAYALGG